MYNMLVHIDMNVALSRAIQKWRGRMFGNEEVGFKPRGPKRWSYSMGDIAEVSGRSERVVREDRRKGLLKAGELGSVVRYVAEHIWRRMEV